VPCATLCQCQLTSQASSVVLTVMEIIYWRMLEISLYVSSNISSVWVQSLQILVDKQWRIWRYSPLILDPHIDLSSEGDDILWNTF
jgi:hypothetical protein